MAELIYNSRSFQTATGDITFGNVRSLFLIGLTDEMSSGLLEKLDCKLQSFVVKRIKPGFFLQKDGLK